MDDRLGRTGIDGGDRDEMSQASATRLTIALAWRAARSARDAAFDSALFYNPAWDILLTLYIGHSQGLAVCVKVACVGSSAPTTTVCRWIETLEHRRLIERTTDPTDRRRTLLSFLPEGLARMERALEDAALGDARLGLGPLRLV